MRPQAVLFDLDGTLLDTIEDLADSMNAVLVALGLPPHDVAAYKRFVGDGIENLVLRALPTGRRDDATVAGSVDRVRREYGRRWKDKTRPYPGIPEMLDGLSTGRIKVGILSNKPHDFTIKTTGALLARWRFDLVWGAREGLPKKPDPTGALRAAASLDVDAGAVIFCGDTDTDMRTAVAAGMLPAGALWGFRDGAELRANGARVLLSHPTDLLCLI